MNTFEQIAELERQFLLQTFTRYQLVLARAKRGFPATPRLRIQQQL
jgi:hypothetical protein